MKILKLQDIKGFLGVKIYKKALIYYEKGHVRNMRIEGSKAEAIILGSSVATYKVRIDFKGSTPDMECDCAYPYLCQHIGALLIKIVNEKLNLEELSPFEVVKHKYWEIHNREEIPLVMEQAEPLALTHLQELYKNLEQLLVLKEIGQEPVEGIKQFPPHAPDVSSRNRARLLFLVKSGADNLALKPALIYFKQNEQPGRLERFTPHHSIEPVTSAELRLLRWLISEKTYENKRVIDYIDLFISQAVPALYLDSIHKQLRLVEIESLVIRFQVFSLNANKTVYFKPIFYFNPPPGPTRGEDSQVDVKAVALAYEDSALQYTSRDCLYLDKERTTLFYKQANPGLSTFFSLFKNRENLFTFLDIEMLKKVVSQYSIPVTIYFPFKKILFKPGLPIPFLKIRETVHEAMLTLYFRYASKEVAYEDEPPLFVNLDNAPGIGTTLLNQAVDDETVLILERQGDYEGLVYNAIKELIHKDLKQRYYVWTNNYLPPAYLPLTIGTTAFLNTFGMELLKNGVELQVNQKKVKAVSRLSLSVKSEMDWFDIQLQAHDTEDKQYLIKDLAKLFTGNMGETNEVRSSSSDLHDTNNLLEDKDAYLLFDQKELAKLKHLFAQGNKEGKGERDKLKISRYNFQFIEEFYEQITNRQLAEVERCKEIMHRLSHFQSIVQHEQPRHFNGTLRSYQKAGYNWLLFLHEYSLNGCLADDMGLGKTIQALAMLQYLKERSQLGVSLLILPVVTLSNWEAELRRFTPQLSFIRHSGKDRPHEVKQLLAYDIILVSYHTLRNDIELFRQIEFNYLILDEAHYIKNVASQIFKAIRTLNGKHRLSLTGTPLENNIMELWAQMDFLNPGLLGSLQSFKANFMSSGEKQPGAESMAGRISGDTSGNTSEIIQKSSTEGIALQEVPGHSNGRSNARLKKLVFPFILRRKKEDVLQELPPKEEIIRYVEMGDKQQKLYNQLKESCRQEILKTIDQKGVNQAAIDIFSALLKLRQMVLFPWMVSKKFEPIESAKFEALKSILEEISSEGHKVLIFSQFIGPLDRIRLYCNESGLKNVILTGQTKNREEVIQAFQKDTEIKVFLLSLRAGGVGINLTEASYVILFDPWWNPAVEAQAVDRAHRMGQVQKVTAYKLIVKYSIEEKILLLQDKKRKLVSELITDDKDFFKSLNRDDILDLFT